MFNKYEMIKIFDELFTQSKKYYNDLAKILSTYKLINKIFWKQNKLSSENILSIVRNNFSDIVLGQGLLSPK